MLKLFQYRIYPPDKRQARKLSEMLEECRWLYNHLLAERKHTHEQEGKGLSCYEQQSTYPMLKQERPSLLSVHSQVLQNVAVRIDLAMKAFFRRAKAGETPASLVSRDLDATTRSPIHKAGSASPTITTSVSPRSGA